MKGPILKLALRATPDDPVLKVSDQKEVIWRTYPVELILDGGCQCCHHPTMRKFKDFSETQILREIIFGEVSLENCHFTIMEVLISNFGLFQLCKIAQFH